MNDELDGNIQVTSDFAEKVNQNKVGIYPVKLDAVDTYGNKANPVTIYVQIENKIAPTLEKIKDQTIEATDKLSELSAIFGIEANDYMTGESLTITYTPDQSIQGNVPGTYPIKVSTKDTAGNTTESNVVLTIIDTTAPTFTAKQSSKKIEINTVAPNWLTFFGIQAIDIVDGDDTKQVKVDASEVKLAQLGEYHVYFTVTDQTGNVANQFITTVQVVDTTPPTLLVTKDKISYPKGKNVSENQFLQDVGASATDNNGIVSITTNFAKVVNWNQAGVYQVTITATDSSGNVTKNVIQVTVKDSDTAIIIKPKNESNNQRKGGSKNVSSKNKKNTPETGDTWNTELLLTGSLLLLAGIWLFRRKNTKTK